MFWKHGEQDLGSNHYNGVSKVAGRFLNELVLSNKRMGKDNCGEILDGITFADYFSQSASEYLSWTAGKAILGDRVGANSLKASAYSMHSVARKEKMSSIAIETIWDPL